MKKTWMRGVSGFLTLAMCLSLLTCGASAVNGYNVTVSGNDTVAVDGTTTLTANPEEIGKIGSWSGGGTDASTLAGDDYAYDPALYVTADGVQEQLSTTERITSGTYNAQGATNVIINDNASGHNGILINNTSYTIKNAQISLITEADGTDTCDFSGKGTAIMAVGQNAVVNIENSKIYTSGVATMPIFVDNGATVTIRNSVLDSQGGTLYQDYMNSPDQTTMVAPPWILGIMGTSRATNMEGNDSTMNVIDSETSAANWAVLSTDSGSNMYLNMYNTSLTLTNADESSTLMQEEGGELGETLDNPYTTNYGAGYGTYVIGDAVETFAGTTVNVGTYAVIFTGGTATFTNLEKGKTYTLKSATGENDVTYVSGVNANSVVNSDTFGFMFHQEANSLTIENGTVVNSKLATFLLKTGSSNETATITVDNSTLNNGGMLIQIMDNDDATNGGMLSADDPLNTNGGSMNFIPYHAENEGFNTDPATAPDSEQNVTLTNGDYSGNVYNASGSDNSDYGPLPGTVLNLTIGEGATLTGAVASTAAIHVTYEGTQALAENGFAAFESEEEAAEFVAEYQNTYYWMNQYYDQGQVANLICDNGANNINVTVTDGAVWTVTGTSVINSLTVGGNGSAVVVPEGVTLTIDGTEYTNCIITYEAVYTDKAVFIDPNGDDAINSWTSGGTTATDNDYLYNAALYIDESGEVVADYSSSERVVDNGDGTYTLEDPVSGHNGIMVVNAEYTISGYTIKMLTDADGTDTCDFSGKGTAIAVYGEKANVTIEDTTIETAGVATMPIFVDSGATVTIRNSVLDSQGGTLYQDYMNSPDQTTMVAPPWILGIMGTSRATNMEGNDSTMNVIDSETSAANWAVLSTDSGSNMYLNMYNTSLTLTNADESSTLMQEEGGELGETLDNPYTTNYGAGYGTYVIGDAVETFAGTTVNVGTYAVIFTGGTATFTNLEKGKTYTLKSATGENDVTYVSGVNANSVVNSDTFGFMFHQEANSLTIENGTVVNSKLATFLLKTGSSNETATITVDNSTLNNGGMLIQIMDNDDATNGGMLSADDPLNTNGGSMNFIPYHAENEGFNTDPATAPDSEQNVTLTNGDYSGNVYNASGSDNSDYGPLPGTVLNLTIGEGATLTGAVASTAAIHVTYEGTQALAENGFAAFESEEEAAEFVAEYQNTYYWMNQYYDQGQVANLICDNGANNINVTVAAGAVWIVTGTSVINSLTLKEGATVVIEDGATLTIDGIEYTADELVGGIVYGTVAEVAASTGSEGGPGGEGGMPPAGGDDFDPSFSDVGTGGIGSGSGGAATVTLGTVAQVAASEGGEGGEGGEGEGMPPEGMPGGGDDPETASPYTYEWTSADESIATVVDNGDGTATVTGVAAGTVEISVGMTKNGTYMGSASMEITVTATFVYNDLTEKTDGNAWYFDAVYAVRDLGLMVGDNDNNFRPNGNLNRAEAAVIAVAIAGIDADEYADTETVFADVSGWATKYIVAAYENGLVAGKGNYIFDPKADVTREEFVTMLLAAMDIDAEDYADEECIFPDVSGWATMYVVAAFENGLTAGYDDGTFGLGKSIKRCEAAVMLDAAL